MPTTIEIRPGEGGTDAETFAHELADTISAHLARHGHTTTEATSKRTTTLTATAPPRLIQWLAGTHRVQRIPTGATARHTSTATIAVLADDQRPAHGRRGLEKELGATVRVDYYRGSGPGGQHKNKTVTAVRLRHLPTGIVVTRDGRSHTDNLNRALQDLQARLDARTQQATGERRQAIRTAQINPERSAKTFTHNWQRGEVVDHDAGRRWTLKQWQKGRLD